MYLVQFAHQASRDFFDKADYQKINRRIPRFCSTAVSQFKYHWKISFFHSFRKSRSRHCVVIELTNNWQATITAFNWHFLADLKHALLICARCWRRRLFVFEPKRYNIHGLLTKRDSHLKIHEFQSLTTILRQQTRKADTLRGNGALRTLNHFVHAQP